MIKKNDDHLCVWVFEVGGIHKITVDDSTKLEAETVIISTGASAKYLNLPSEQRLRGGGVSALEPVRAGREEG